MIVERMTGPTVGAQPVIDVAQLRALQDETLAVYVDPSLIEYAVAVTGATRYLGAVGLADCSAYFSFGASPRASINTDPAAKAIASCTGRDYVVPEDVRALALDVLRHRIVPSDEALGEAVSSDEALERVLTAVPMPEIPPTVRPSEEPALQGTRPTTPEAVLRLLERRVLRRLDCRIRAITERSCTAVESTSPARESTSRATTFAISSGIPRPAWTRRGCGPITKIASSRPGCCSTDRRR